jgi:HK97 family phage major capsid protein
VENENTEVVAEASAPVVEAAAPAPIYTRPRVKPLTDGEAFAHAVYAASGREESKRILIEAADDTSNNTGFTVSRGLPSFISNTFDSRPAVDAVGVQALPATGLTYTIPNLTVAPEVDEVAELDPVVQTDMESDYITIDVKKLAGKQIVSFELLDRSEPSFGELMLRELRRAYAKKTDQYLLAELLAGGSSATVQAADWKGLQAFVATEVPVAYSATGGLIANELIGSSAWWSELIGAKDDSDRPVFNAIAPSNAGGSVGISSPIGSAFGTTFRVDHNISTVGLVDNSAFLVARDAVGFWESSVTNLRTNILSDGSVEVELYGYVAAKVLKPSGVRKYQA